MVIFRLSLILILSLLSLSLHAQDAEPTLKSSVEQSDSLRVLLLNFNKKNLDEESAQLITSVTGVALSEFEGVDLISGADIKRAIELEGEKELMGCDPEASSCLAEIAGAMAAEFVVLGEVGKLGESTLATITLYSPEEVKSLGRISIQVQSLEEYPAKVREKLPTLMGDLLESRGFARPVVSASEPEKSSFALVPAITLGAGAISTLVGGALLIFGTQPIRDYSDAETLFESDKERGREAAALAQKNWDESGFALSALGTTLALLGGITLATGGVMFALEE